MGEGQMMIVGERINASRQPIAEALKRKDAQFFINEVSNQINAGASVIDVNCGIIMESEMKDMLWLIDTIQKDNAVRISIDSPNPDVIKEALESQKGPKAMINSITAEKTRYEKILPLCAKYDCDIIALTMDEKGMPHTAGQRFEIATIIMEICAEYGVKKDRIYIDPLIRPISTEQTQAEEILISIEEISKIGLKTIAGLSNISYGLPNRSLINRTFLAMASYAGLSACIIDPTDIKLMSVVRAAMALTGSDENSISYIKAFRDKKLV